MQVQIKDLENNLIFGGIMYKNGDVIRLDDGRIYPVEERDITYEVKVFDLWANLSKQVLAKMKKINERRGGNVAAG